MLENIYDSCRGNLYRFRYLNQEETSSVFLSRKGHPILGEILSRNGEVTINYLEFSNLTKDFKKREKTKTIVIKRKWDFYNELMDFLVEM